MQTNVKVTWITDKFNTIAFEYSDKHKEFVVGVKSNLRLYLSFSVCPQEWSYLTLSQHITIYQSNRKKAIIFSAHQ